jgi:hypothetical protein
LKHSLPTRKLPERPDLAQLKRQAKELLEERRAEGRDGFALHDAQLELARSYGYDSWPRLKAFVDGVTVQRLTAAVRAGLVSEARALLEARPELINMVEAGEHGCSALQYAVLGRMPEMVRMLMEFGANPHAGISRHSEATCALAIAEERDYREIAAIFRRTGRGTFVVPKEPLDLLRRAFQAGDEARVLEVLNLHPELIRFPPLEELCSRARKAETIDALSGLFPHRKDELRARAAVIRGDAEWLRARLAGDDSLKTPQDDQGWLLRLAVDLDRPGIVQVLLGAGFDPDARARVEGSDEVTFTWGVPLYQCARYGKHEMARMLLERGADPNGQVYAGGTPLSEAFGQRDEEMIALLERFGGQPNPSMAGLYRRKDLARKMLDRYRDESLPDDGFGSGPVPAQLLAAAARGGDPEILAMALERIDWPAGDGRWYGALAGPLGFWNHWTGPWCHPEWDRSTYLTCFRMLLARSGPPNRQLRFGVTVLHEVATMGSHVTAEERAAFASALLEAGARVDLRDDLLKSTALGWACRWGREELVRLLLEQGADPVEPDAEEWARPLAWAGKKGHGTIAGLLRERGA